MVLIAILKIQIGFHGVKTCFFTNFFSHFEDESEHFASFFGSKNVEIKDFGLGFPLEEKVVVIAILQIQIGFHGVIWGYFALLL